MAPFLMVPPAGPVVPFEGGSGLQFHCRADTDEEQALIEAYEQGAVALLDGYSGRLGRCLLSQKWAFPLYGEPEILHLPFPDCRDFKIERLVDDAWATVEGVTLQPFEDQVCLSDMPDDWSGLHLTCIAGWETAEDVPANLVQAIKMLVAHWFVNRAAVSSVKSATEVPIGFEALISPYVNVI